MLTFREIVDPGALLLLVAANATPVLLAKVAGNRFALPIDAMFRRDARKPLFGDHKTWRGLASGALASALVGSFLACGAWSGLGFGFLALCGDLASSFVKRRMHLQSGYSAPLLDQLPEALLPLIAFAAALTLTDVQIFGTALAFTLLDLAVTRWRSACMALLALTMTSGCDRHLPKPFEPIATAEAEAPSGLRAVRGQVGITLRDVDAGYAQSSGLDLPRGAVITAVEPGGPGEIAGLRVGRHIRVPDKSTRAPTAHP